MDKDFSFANWEGWLQITGFTIYALVLYCNLLAMYVGMAQQYHTLRLTTAGPSGFEMAASYYLNPIITHYRHLAVKAMLWSLPFFLFGSVLRIIYKFDKDQPGGPEP